MSLFVFIGFVTFAVIWNLMIVCCIGCNRKLKSAIRLLLQALLLTDTVMMVLNIVLVIQVELLVINPQRIAGSEFQRVWLPSVARYSLPSFRTAHMASVWLVVLISVDRYLATHSPKIAVKYLTSTWQIGVAVLGVWVASTLVNLSRFFEFEVTYSTNSTSEITIATFRTTWLAENQIYNYLYNFCLYAVLMIILPFVILSFAHLKLAGFTRRLRRSEQPTTDNNSTCRKCYGSCTVSGPFTFIICVLFQVSPVFMIVTKLVSYFSEVSEPALLGCSSIELVFNVVSRFFVYHMFFRHIYVDPCKLVNSASIFHVVVEKVSDNDENKVYAKEVLVCSQPELNVDNELIGGSENWEASEAAQRGTVNVGYERTHD